MTKKKAYVLVFDGLADWEPALALCEINKNDSFEVVTVGLSKELVTTCGGIPTTPQITLEDIKAKEASIFILPGGDPWEQQPIEDKLLELLQKLHAQGVALAAICGATLAMARAGLLKNIHHTSNGKSYLKTFVQDYAEDALYVDKLAVTDNNIITASGIGSIEFAYEIIKALNLYAEAEAQEWFDLFKHGVIPQAWQEAASSG
jgi:putative intracellular protease/amidase